MKKLFVGFSLLAVVALLVAGPFSGDYKRADFGPLTTVMSKVSGLLSPDVANAKSSCWICGTDNELFVRGGCQLECDGKYALGEKTACYAGCKKSAELIRYYCDR